MIDIIPFKYLIALLLKEVHLRDIKLILLSAIEIQLEFSRGFFKDFQLLFADQLLEQDIGLVFRILGFTKILDLLNMAFSLF